MHLHLDVIPNFLAANYAVHVVEAVGVLVHVSHKVEGAGKQPPTHGAPIAFWDLAMIQEPMLIQRAFAGAFLVADYASTQIL